MSEVNAGHGLEVLHVSHILQEMLHTHIAEHVWMKAHTELGKAIDAASDALGDLYQQIGNSVPDEELEKADE